LVLNGDNTIEFLHKYNNHIWDKDIANGTVLMQVKLWCPMETYAGKVDQIQILIDE
jgi:hypothetical protein